MTRLIAYRNSSPLVVTRNVLSNRRKFLSGAGATLLAACGLRPKLAIAATEIIVTNPPFNAVPNSNQDNSPMFQSALDYISKCGGGVLQVPGGTYLFHSPLKYSGSSLTILGSGQEVSVVVVQHSGTGLTVNLADATCCLTLKDIGITPMPGGQTWSAGAIACIVPGQQGDTTNFLAEDVDFGVAFGEFGQQYSAYYQVIELSNTKSARISNCNAHANLLTGGIFLNLYGGCCDTRVMGCSIDAYAWGVVVSAYSVGLHITDTVFIGGTAVQTGARAYNGRVNLAGLYISGCEFNCKSTVLSLYQVNSGCISDSDIYGPQVATANIACKLIGCEKLTLHQLEFGGQFVGKAAEIGIFATSSTTGPTLACRIDDCSFENTGIAIVYDVATTSCFATAIAMYQAGLGALVNTPIVWSNAVQQVFVDNSGNTSNDVSWLTSTANIPAASTGRIVYEH